MKMSNGSVDFGKKQPLCIYDPEISFEDSRGGLRFFIPTANGFVNYNLVHTVNFDRACDTWRLSIAYAFDDNLENGFPLTPPGAEWDMALRLNGRPDFIGGFAHGDEKCTLVEMQIDGNKVEIDSILELTPFKEIKITVNSKGFDPLSPAKEVLNHSKEYTIDENGVTLDQRVAWLGDYTLGASYMAMMPPLKTLTDRFYTDINKIPLDPTEYYDVKYFGATEAVVYGETSGISYSMSVEEKQSLEGGNHFLLSDNGRGKYNKMYFVICNGARVSRGDEWVTMTKYKITIKQ